MTLAFVSNYINHHQLPLCGELYGLLGEDFVFFETEELAGERAAMGWGREEKPSYVRFLGREETRRLLDFDMVLFGDAPEELIRERLLKDLPTIRISESIYKEGQWKFISPRGLKQKYRDHIRFRRGRVWLLCAGGYVASDFSLIGAYPEKKLKWGYFPETKAHELDGLMAGKPLQRGERPRLLWAGRMIDWKHPETALFIAESLKKEGFDFSLEFIGEGPLREGLQERARDLSEVSFTSFLSPAEVREKMEGADVFFLCSDNREGWGAVANEAMNSGCVLVASSGAGAVPFLAAPGKNALVYPKGDEETALKLTKRALTEPAFARALGKEAYGSIAGLWNERLAAGRLVSVCEAILSGAEPPDFEAGPCSPALPLSPGAYDRYVRSVC